MIWRWEYLFLPLILCYGQNKAELSEESSPYTTGYGGTDESDLAKVFDGADTLSNDRAGEISETDYDLEHSQDQLLADSDDDGTNRLVTNAEETDRIEGRSYGLQDRLKIDAADDGEASDQEGQRLSQRSEGNGGISDNSSTQPPPNIVKVRNTPARAELDDIYFLFIVIGCSVAGIAGLALAGYCWYKLHTTAKAVSEAEYTGYGSRKPSEGIKGDQKLDYNAEMYHYHQTKSQLAAMEKAKGAGSVKGEDLDDEESADEGDDGDFTVYECPGLAPTGDMTVVNPLFSDQENVGSDQDTNGHSRKTSPVISKDAHRDK